jgi:hypothetical protein
MKKISACNKTPYQLELLHLHHQALQFVHEELVACLAVGQILAESFL